MGVEKSQKNSEITILNLRGYRTEEEKKQKRKEGETKQKRRVCERKHTEMKRKIDAERNRESEKERGKKNECDWREKKKKHEISGSLRILLSNTSSQ